MPTPEIEEFAQVLVQQVRDAAIQSSDRRLRLNASSPVAKRWRGALSGATPDAFPKVAIPDIVDDALFYLLQAIDQGTLRLSFSASNGRTVDLCAEGLGELSGWYMGRGWRDVHSKERFYDVLDDSRG
jgi:hypothetical protein